MTAFGRSLLRHWCLDPEITYLNHGTVGAPPRRVLEAQAALRQEMERQPARFMLRELTQQVGVPRPGPGRLRRAAAEVARFVGAAADDFAFVDNATTGANAVLRSLELGAGDEIVVTDMGYGGVVRAAEFVARRAGARLVTVAMPWPGAAAAAFADAIEAALTPRSRLLVVDHIAAESALVLPLEEIARRCRRRGVLVLADGAHAPGQIALDVPALGVDWYAANLHKWAQAPRSSGFLWCRAELRNATHPVVISWGLDRGFAAEFDWVGTRDPTPFLAAPEGLAFLRELGWQDVLAYNHGLALAAGAFLAREWGTRFDTPEAMVGAMVTVPLPAALGSRPASAERIRDALLFEHRIEVQVHAWRETLWVRVSAQVYNEMADTERLASAVASLAGP
jgi:isopenicillin-N epimerase